MRVLQGLAMLLVALPICASAMTSYRNSGPLSWMHQLPPGETPGWSTGAWFDIELNHANIWNKEFSMTDRRTGDLYTYYADFEQSSAILEMGGALNKSFALSLEIPYAYRNGGFLDDFIDQFHVAIGSSRFMRNINHDFQEKFRIETNGENRLTTEPGEGVSSWKLKLKYWLWQKRAKTPGICECGFALSLQSKFPFQHWAQGLSSGTTDHSGLVHLGLPFWKHSGMWATAGFTKVGKSAVFEGWPKRQWLQMYELTLNLGLGPKWGVILQARTESPLFMKEHLDYNYTMTEPEGQTAERVASGWNSMMHWRGSESIGLRRVWGAGSQVNLMIVEDWGTGRHDSRGDWLYVNNAPDVIFLTQMHFVF